MYDRAASCKKLRGRRIRYAVGLGGGWVRRPIVSTKTWLLPVLCCAAAAAADNPLARDPEAFEAGRTLYLQRCAVCHGQDAKGSMAADLLRSRVVARGPDQGLFRIIREGIPGTEMFAHDIPDDAIWRIVAYLHGLARPGDRPPLPGDPERGARVFVDAGCAGCHTAGGEGGFFGPDLSSIALQRTAEDIRRSVVDPGAAAAEGFRAVFVVDSAGRSVSGLLRNEDTFSLQILTRDGEHVSLLKSEVRSRRDDGTPMPGNAETLSAEDLRDLLAFLDRQRRPFVPDDSGFGNY